MDISSRGKYPANKLSNFAGHRFVLDGVQINSFEGFLQSLKFKSPAMQAEVCKLVGYAAKKRGSKKNWQKNQILYWQGKEYKRQGPEYQALLDRAYNAMFEQSEGFRKALAASGDAVYKHSMGRNTPSETVLTTREFCSRLDEQRKKLKSKLF